MTDAVGIHAHESRKLGRRPPSNKRALLLSDVLTGVVPAHPLAVDHVSTFLFGLYENDTFGDCGPTSVANLRRAVTAGLLGQEVPPTQADVFDLYTRSGNPDFDPNDPGGPGDGGVDMQTMLEALLADGIGGVKPLAFAKVDVTNDGELDAAVSIFGGVLWGVDLKVAQQAQTDAGEWDYEAGSGEWGGHAIVELAFDEQARTEDVISWALRVKTTAAFRRHQLEEAWVVIWQENLDHPAFQQGVDLDALQSAYKALTGKTIPGVPTPPPPTPVPGGGGPPQGPFLVGPFSAHVADRLHREASRRSMTVEQYLTYHVEVGSSHWRK